MVYSLDTHVRIHAYIYIYICLLQVFIGTRLCPKLLTELVAWVRFKNCRSCLIGLGFRVGSVCTLPPMAISCKSLIREGFGRPHKKGYKKVATPQVGQRNYLIRSSMASGRLVRPRSRGSCLILWSRAIFSDTVKGCQIKALTPADLPYKP